MNQIRRPLAGSSAILSFLLSLAAAPVIAQVAGSAAGSSSPQLQTSADLNLRIEKQSEKLAAGAAMSRSEDSRIGPYDLLNIAVFEAPEMNTIVRVSAGGEISLPLLGPVRAAGSTPRELGSVLQGMLRSKYMKDPHVSVFVQELQSHAVSVVGAVKMPGVFQIHGTKTVIEVLSMAQGLADDAGDIVLVMREGEYAGQGNSEAPGSHLVATASGAAPQAAAPQNSSALTPAANHGSVEEIDLKELLDSANSTWNVPVRPGDIVKVPRAGIVYVVGEVHKPGGFVLQNNENISVLQALALAEGPTHTSAIRRSRIIRTDPVSGSRTEIPLNLGKILSGNAPDRLLQPKDIVFVPNSAAKTVFYRGSEAALQTAAGVAIYRW